MVREGGKVEYGFGNGVTVHRLRRVGPSPTKANVNVFGPEEAEQS